jgi:uncharacterized membrane protein
VPTPPEAPGDKQSAAEQQPAPAFPTPPHVIGPLPGTVFVPVVGGAPIQLPFPGMVARVQQQVQVWQSPYPSPEALREYERLQPGAFNRMLTMAEQAQAAQINSIKIAQENQRTDTRRVQFLGAGITVLAICAAVYLAMHGQTVVAGLLLSVPVMSVGKALIESARQLWNPAAPSPPPEPPSPQNPPEQGPAGQR